MYIYIFQMVPRVLGFRRNLNAEKKKKGICRRKLRPMPPIQRQTCCCCIAIADNHCIYYLLCAVCMPQNNVTYSIIIIIMIVAKAFDLISVCYVINLHTRNRAKRIETETQREEEEERKKNIHHRFGHFTYTQSTKSISH